MFWSYVLQWTSNLIHYFSNLFSSVAQVNPLHCLRTIIEALEFLHLDFLYSCPKFHLIFVSHCKKSWRKIATNRQQSFNILKQNVAFLHKEQKQTKKCRHNEWSNILTQNPHKQGRSHQWECRWFHNLHYRCAMQKVFVSATARLVIRCENGSWKYWHFS